MRKWLLWALATGALHAALIRGTVVENQSGHPLARALVVLQPVAGASGGTQSVRTNAYGLFEFPPLPAGVYLITASRRGFATVEYGQKGWKAAGVPVSVEDSTSLFLNIRLPRFAAIEGTVLDENDVGLPDHDVVAYSNTRPPRLAARGKTDDRGIYRLSGLTPGSYLVRTVGKQYEEGGYLPTFSKETVSVDQAYPVEVNLDQEISHVDVRPFPGRLYTLEVTVRTSPPGMVPVTLTFVSDMGRQTVQTSGSYRFESLPPGPYEIFAQAPLQYRAGIQAAYDPIEVSRDAAVTVSTTEVRDTTFEFAGTPPQTLSSTQFQVMARRRDLAGDGPPQALKLTGNRAPLGPGPWDLSMAPPAGYYVTGFAGFFGSRSDPPPDARFDGWNAILGASSGIARFTLSPNPCAVHGTVSNAGNPVAGAPVFLESSDLPLRRRLTEMTVSRTDIHGQYQFTGLAPGNYRILSSFEFQMPDSTILSAAGAKSLKLEDHRDALQDLDLYVIR